MLFLFKLNKQALHFHLLTVQPCFFHQSPSKALWHFTVFLRQFLHDTILQYLNSLVKEYVWLNWEGSCPLIYVLLSVSGC
jgi:hypothetical protein